MTFDELHLHPALLGAVHAIGYVEPTPVQQNAIPLVLSGADLMVQAATGTGKTAAFALPMLHRLLDKPRGQIRGLVLSPTRELAEQTQKHLIQLGRRTRLRSLSLYGGVSIYGQSARLKAGIELVTACPGRLLDHMRQGTVRLDQLEILVIDEADSLFQMGFIDDVRSIIKHVPASCQRLLFSATLPPAVKELAGDALREPQILTVDRQAPAATVDHALYPVPGSLKVRLLNHLLNKETNECVVVFTRTRHGASRLAQTLETLGFRTACLQGQLSQRQRNAALTAFRRRELQVLVATDVASRGIDVSGVSHVINYDIPATAETYIHRAGRTGRAETAGKAITFVAPGDEGLVRQIERSLGQKLIRRRLQDFDYGSKEKTSGKPAGLKQPVPGKAQRVPEQAVAAMDTRLAGPETGFRNRKKDSGRRDCDKKRMSDTKKDTFRPLRRNRGPYWERDERFPEKDPNGIRYFTRNEIFSPDTTAPLAKRAPNPKRPRCFDKEAPLDTKGGLARRAEHGRQTEKRPAFTKPEPPEYQAWVNNPENRSLSPEERQRARKPHGRNALKKKTGQPENAFPKGEREGLPRDWHAKKTGSTGNGSMPLRKKTKRNGTRHEKDAQRENNNDFK